MSSLVKIINNYISKITEMIEFYSFIAK